MENENEIPLPPDCEMDFFECLGHVVETIADVVGDFFDIFF